MNVGASEGATCVRLIGHGIKFNERHELTNGVFIDPFVPTVDLQIAADACPSFQDYASIICGKDLSDFSISVEDEPDARSLSAKAWNSLWLFNYLSISCGTPCLSLYSISDGLNPIYSSITFDYIARPLPNIHVASSEEVEWASRNLSSYSNLLDSNTIFQNAVRCYSLSATLFHREVRIMLLWSAIEGMLDVTQELSHRLALYASILFDGNPEEKHIYYKFFKKAYSIRSTVVHGGKSKTQDSRDALLKQGYDEARQILRNILVRCVELGRVPSQTELDMAAVSTVLK